MSSATTPRKLDKPKPTATDEEKHCKHAEAQRKYREKSVVSAQYRRELIVCQKSRSNTREGAREDVQVCVFKGKVYLPNT
jgi:hypothetical protein